VECEDRSVEGEVKRDWASESAEEASSEGNGGLTDIAARLRLHAASYLRHYPWDWSEDAVPLLEEAASEIITLRNMRQEAGALLVAYQLTRCPHVVGTTTQYCSLTPFTLTDEERESLTRAVTDCERIAREYGIEADERRAAALRGLLERLK
jgi:hypothetical protein